MLSVSVEYFIFLSPFQEPPGMAVYEFFGGKKIEMKEWKNGTIM
jgi:hypothetical protein